MSTSNSNPATDLERTRPASRNRGRIRAALLAGLMGVSALGGAVAPAVTAQTELNTPGEAVHAASELNPAAPTSEVTAPETTVQQDAAPSPALSTAQASDDASKAAAFESDTESAAGDLDPSELPSGMDEAVAKGYVATGNADMVSDSDLAQLKSTLGAVPGFSIGKWNDSAWNNLVGSEHSQDVSIQDASGNTVTGTFTYDEFGNSDGPTLVLLGGIGTTKTQWDPEFLAPLANDFHLIILDYPGAGTATIDNYANFTVENLAEFTYQFTQDLGLDHPNILGYAFSGKIAALMMQDHGADLGKYINIAGHIYAPSGESVHGDTLDKLTSKNVLEVAMAAWPKTPWGMLNAAAVGLRTLSHTQEPRTDAALQAYRDAQSGWDYGPLDVATISNDTLIVAGGLDDIATPADMKATAELMSEAGTQVTYKQYARAAHTVQYQYRPWVLSDINSFLG